MEAVSYPPQTETPWTEVPGPSEAPGVDPPGVEIPRASFHFIWDGGLIAEGPHDLAIRILPHEGEPRLFGERRIFVVHP